MSPLALARVRWLVVLIAFIPILACSPLELVQQQAPAPPTAQALATQPVAVLPTTAPTVAPTSTRAATAVPTASPTPATRYALIAFVSDRDGAPELYTMKPDGSAQTRLTSSQGKDTLPAWSPDGSKIAFLSERSGGLGLYVMNADGSNATMIFKDSLNPSEAPAWSPDGKRLAVVVNEKALSQIYVVNADGSGKARVTDGKADEFGPSWSPDGTKLAFQSKRDKNAQGYFINVDGTGLKHMTLDVTSAWMHPIYSPDGKKLALVKAGTPSKINTMNIDGGALMALVDSDGMSTRFSWSPDGKKIVFNRAVNDKDQIFVIDTDGKSAAVALTSAGKNYYPTWCCTAAPVTMLDAPKATLVAAQPTVKATSTATVKATTASSSSSAAPKATTASSSSAAGDASALVKSALDAMMQKSFRGTIKGGTSPMTFEFVPPDNFHTTIDANEYIFIAFSGQADAYMKSGSTWSKTDASSAGFLLLPITIGCGFADTITNAKALPNETLNGASMKVVSYTGKYDMGGPGDPGIAYKMWIGTDGLPRQVTWQQTGQAVGTTTMQYDSTIKITAPPVP